MKRQWTICSPIISHFYLLSYGRHSASRYPVRKIYPLSLSFSFLAAYLSVFSVLPSGIEL